MGKSLVSNPPYNMKWSAPPFAQMQPRFFEYGTAPDSNANFAFISTALDWIDDKAAILLPPGALSADGEEAAIRAAMVEHNVIDAVITLPDSMFESTSIGTCILLFNKHKETLKIELVDMRQEHSEEVRDQNGQFGGAPHENRTYHKTVNILTDENMQRALDAIRDRKDEPGFSRAATIEEIRKNQYILTPSRYIEAEEREAHYRDFADIARDYNAIVRAKNAIKLTVNESLAKSLGLHETFKMMQDGVDVSKSFEVVGQKAEKESYISLSKNAAEFKIENRNKDYLPEALALFLQTWKQHIMYLNNEQNIILAEFRDALLPKLMNGEIDVSETQAASGAAQEEQPIQTTTNTGGGNR